MPVKTAVDLQLLETKYLVIQLAMNRSRRVSFVLTLKAVLPTWRCSVLERSYCFVKFLIGCGRVVRLTAILSAGQVRDYFCQMFRAISGLHTKCLCNDGHFCRQLLLKQSKWLNLC